MMDRMEKEPLIQEGGRLPDVADIDGLVSFMGRLTEEQESFYLDLLLASLVRLHPFIKSDDVKRMMPVSEWAGVQTLSRTRTKESPEYNGPRIASMELTEKTPSTLTTRANTLSTGVYFRLIVFRKSGNNYVFQSAAD